MLVHMVQFESKLSEAELRKIAEERAPRYRATPGLVQKYYVKLDRPGWFAGIMIWEDRAALAAFRETELARTVGEVYQTVGTPQVNIHELWFPLRPEAMPAKTEWVA